MEGVAVVPVCFSDLRIKLTLRRECRVIRDVDQSLARSALRGRNYIIPEKLGHQGE